MTLSEYIVNYRNTHGLSQRALAAQCGVSTGYISLLEKRINPQTGKYMTPSLSQLKKLATGMRTDIDTLFHECDDMDVSVSVDSKSSDERDIEIAALITTLSSEKKSELLRYLRYLASDAED